MQVLAVFLNQALGTQVAQALEILGAKMSLYSDVDKLVKNHQFQNIDGLIVEDDEQHLPTWLNFFGSILPGSTPVVVYGSGGSSAMVRALSLGAHDYVSIQEGVAAIWHRLFARFEAVQIKSLDQRLRAGDYMLDKRRQLISFKTAIEALTTRETRLLALLAAKIGNPTTLEVLSQDLCRQSVGLSQRSVEQHVYRVRKKINALHKATGSDGGLRLVVVYGVGYKLEILN